MTCDCDSYHDQLYDDCKSMGRKHYKNKRHGKIRKQGETHHSEPIRFDPLRAPSPVWKYVYGDGEKDISDSRQLTFFGDYFYSPYAFRAISKYYNFANMCEIVQFLKDIYHFTPENLKKMIQIVYVMKNNRRFTGSYCWECGSYECQIAKVSIKKKKTLNRKLVNHFDEKTNEYYRDVSLSVEKKKKEKKQCMICYEKKRKCITLPTCGEVICSECESMMSLSKTGCYFCRQQACLRHQIKYYSDD